MVKKEKKSNLFKKVAEVELLFLLPIKLFRVVLSPWHDDLGYHHHDYPLLINFMSQEHFVCPKSHVHKKA